MVQLDSFIWTRAEYRAVYLKPSIEANEVYLVSSRMWDRLTRKLDFERLCSEGLSVVQRRYRCIKEAIQDTLDTHKRLLESVDYPGKLDDFQSLNAAVLDLEEKSASFDSTIRRLLHTVYLTESEAWVYSMALSRTLFGADR